MAIHLETWIQQPKILAERCRGLALIWTPDVQWFNNDWLGPTPHCHEDATEIAFLVQGQLEIEVGGSKRVYKAGDFIVMPPNHTSLRASAPMLSLATRIAPAFSRRETTTAFAVGIRLRNVSAP